MVASKAFRTDRGKTRFVVQLGSRVRKDSVFLRGLATVFSPARMTFS